MKTPCTRPDIHNRHSINVRFPSVCLNLFSNKIENPSISQEVSRAALSLRSDSTSHPHAGPDAPKVQVRALLCPFSPERS